MVHDPHAAATSSQARRCGPACLVTATPAVAVAMAAAASCPTSFTADATDESLPTRTPARQVASASASTNTAQMITDGRSQLDPGVRTGPSGTTATGTFAAVSEEIITRPPAAEHPAVPVLRRSAYPRPFAGFPIPGRGSTAGRSAPSLEVRIHHIRSCDCAG